MLMEQSTRACSNATERKAKAPTPMLMATSMLANTSTASRTELEWLPGQTEADTKALGKMDKGVEMELTPLPTDKCFKWSERPEQKQQNLRVEDYSWFVG